MTTKYGGLFMVHEYQTTRLLGSLRVSVEEGGAGWLHLTWSNDEAAYQVLPSSDGLRLVLSRASALMLVGLLHVQVEALRQLGALPANAALMRSDASQCVRVVSSAKNQVLEISWDFPSGGSWQITEPQLLSVDAQMAEVIAWTLTAEFARVAVAD